MVVLVYAQYIDLKGLGHEIEFRYLNKNESPLRITYCNFQNGYGENIPR